MPSIVCPLHTTQYDYEEYELWTFHPPILSDASLSISAHLKCVYFSGHFSSTISINPFRYMQKWMWQYSWSIIHRVDGVSKQRIPVVHIREKVYGNDKPVSKLLRSSMLTAQLLIHVYRIMWLVRLCATDRWMDRQEFGWYAYEHWTHHQVYNTVTTPYRYTHTRPWPIYVVRTSRVST